MTAPTASDLLIDISLAGLDADILRIATLGPAGTSSEAAAGYLGLHLRLPDKYTVALYEEYERAAAAVLAGDSDVLIVANAYHAASTFYMDTNLSLLGAFVFDTPQYGLATRDGRAPQGGARVSSHPAPIPIIDQLFEYSGAEVAEVVKCSSTSAAAEAAATGEVDVALTTSPAASLYDLRFVSRTRHIRMLWSAFGRDCDASCAPRQP